jgi:osmoprotectant transport system substrate-binding protein
MLAHHRRLAWRALGSLALLAMLSGCAMDNPLDLGERPPGDSLVVGSLGSAQSEMVAQLYGQVLEAEGLEVEYDQAIGSRRDYLMAMSKGALDLVPDYTTDLLAYFDPQAAGLSQNELLARVRSDLEPLGISVLNPSHAVDSDALVVTSHFAEANQVSTIADLAVKAPGLTFGGDENFEAGPFGRDSLATNYGVAGWTFLNIDDHGGDPTVAALISNTVQVAIMRTTSPAVGENNFVVLEDPIQLDNAQVLAPVVAEELDTPRIRSLLNRVSTKLTTGELSRMIGTYNSDARPTARLVAHTWLVENGFIEPEPTPTPTVSQ